MASFPRVDYLFIIYRSTWKSLRSFLVYASRYVFVLGLGLRRPYSDDRLWQVRVLAEGRLVA